MRIKLVLFIVCENFILVFVVLDICQKHVFLDSNLLRNTHDIGLDPTNTYRLDMTIRYMY